jgi:hypothetical protein
MPPLPLYLFEGKYLQIRFSAQYQPTGIAVTEYLLERPRVCSQVASRLLLLCPPLRLSLSRVLGFHE